MIQQLIDAMMTHLWMSISIIIILGSVYVFFVLRPLSVWLTYWIQGVPCAPFIPFIGQGISLLRAFYENRAGALFQQFSDNGYGSVFALCVGFMPCLVCSDADVFMQVVKHDYKCFEKGEIPNAAMTPIIGARGMMTAPEPYHSINRRALTPSFHYDNLRSMISIMIDSAEERVETIKKSISPANQSTNHSKSIDIKYELSEVALTIISSCAFGASLTLVSGASDVIHRTFTAVLEMMNVRNLSFIDHIPLVNRLPLLYKRAVEQQMLVTRKVVDRMVAARRSGESHSMCAGHDLLDFVLLAHGNDDAQVREESLTMILAGHETTASLMSFLFSELVPNRSLLTECQAEVDRVIGDEQHLTEAHLVQLTLCEAVINETLRMYPPAPVLFRTCISPVELQTERILGRDVNVTIPRDSMVALDVYSMHRNIKYFGARAGVFDPYRWVKDHERYEPPIVAHAFKPFSDGPRSCVGAKFAMLEAKVLLATLLHHFEFDWQPQIVEQQIKATFTPKKVMVTLKSRR